MLGNWRQQVSGNPAFGIWYERYRRRPGWVTRASLGAAILVIVVPLVLLTLAAVCVGAAVFIVLSLVASMIRLCTGGADRDATTDDGRRNVRVMQR